MALEASKHFTKLELQQHETCSTMHDLLTSSIRVRFMTLTPTLSPPHSPSVRLFRLDGAQLGPVSALESLALSICHSLPIHIQPA